MLLNNRPLTFAMATGHSIYKVILDEATKIKRPLL